MQELKLKQANASLRFHDLLGAGTPILFIHGIGCASSFDYPQVAAGLKQHRCILVDLLGYGYSDKPSGFDYRMDSHADTLVELVNHLQLNELIIFAHSMGGAVAINLANKLQGRVKSLILAEANLDSGGGFFSKRMARYSEADYVNCAHDEIIIESVEKANSGWAASLRASSALAVHRSALSLIAGETPEWRETLYSLDLAKTFIFGAKSLPDADFEELPKHGIKVEVIADAGHSMAWDNPAGLAEAIAKSV